MDDGVPRLGRFVSGFAQERGARGVASGWVAGAKERSDVAQACRRGDRVDDGVGDDIAIGMTLERCLSRPGEAGEHGGAGGGVEAKAMDIDAEADAKARVRHRAP